MFENIENARHEINPFTNEEMVLIRNASEIRSFKKRETLLKEGEVCNFVAWVAKGCLRLYFTDGGGTEHVLDFALEGDTVIDRKSFQYKTPSIFQIDALEDGEAWFFSLKALNELAIQVPNFEKVLRMESLRNLAKYQNRIAMTLTLSADEKYKLLARQNPELLKRVPQHMIASYLGITPATLSRVRKNLEAPDRNAN